MATKNLKSVTTDLSELAAGQPTQRVEKTSTKKAPAEPIAQFSLGMRESLKIELQQLALDKRMTMRALVLNALRKEGLAGVTDEDLLDLRKQKR